MLCRAVKKIGLGRVLGRIATCLYTAQGLAIVAGGIAAQAVGPFRAVAGAGLLGVVISLCVGVWWRRVARSRRDLVAGSEHVAEALAPDSQNSLFAMTDLSFTVPRADLKKAVPIIQAVAKDIEAKSVSVTETIAKVSLIGVGMRSHSGVAAKMFEVLSREGINIMMISTSEIKISCVIDEKYGELAVRILHEAFGLGTPKEGELASQ